MRKVILFNLITLDGLFEGPGRDITWHNVDEEFNQFAIEQTDSAGGLIFGRITYELMATYWPSEFALEMDPVVAQQMNSIEKIVFSRTLERVDWKNTRLVKTDAVEEIPNLKQQPGNDLFIFGSANLASNLTKHGLIDEYRILLNPIVLGRGVPLFQGVEHMLKLKLTQTKSFKNGNVLLCYQPEEK